MLRWNLLTFNAVGIVSKVQMTANIYLWIVKSGKCFNGIHRLLKMNIYMIAGM